MSASGDRLYATGQTGHASTSDYMTVAYDAQDGRQLWLREFGNVGNVLDAAMSVDASPDGSRVYVTGLSDSTTTDGECVTLAYDGATGVQLWTFRYRGPSTLQEQCNQIVVAPDGSRVYAVGNTRNATGLDDYLVLAFDITEPPVASLTADVTSGDPPLTVTFSLSGSDSDGNLSGWRFDAEGDGVAEVSGSGQPPAQLQHTYEQSGSFRARLTVADDHGAIGTDEVTVTVTAPPPSNSPPVASLSAIPSSGPAPLTVTLDASGSSDADGASDITGYSFDFGDGSATVTQAGATIGHTYNSAGSFTARVTVTDSAGNTDSAQTPVTVQSGPGANQPPVAKLVATPTSGIAPLAVSFDASGSTDPDNDITGYTFNFGDGSAPVSQATPTTSHTYDKVGSFSARVIVTDSQGATASMVVVISVQAAGQPPNSAPAASLAVSPASGQAPLTVTFDGSGSSDPNGDAIASYSFDFGDNSGAVTQTGPTISHTYDAAGTYRASLSVTDSQGQSSEPVFVTVTVTTSVTVTPPGGPVAALKLTNNRGPAPLTVGFDGSKSFDPAGGTIQSYIFDFGDGSAVVTRTVSQFGVNAPLTSHVYLVPGTYTPSLSVTNQDGVVSPNPATAKVEATGPPGGGSGGGALGLLTLLPLLGIGLVRRRRH